MDLRSETIGGLPIINRLATSTATSGSTTALASIQSGCGNIRVVHNPRPAITTATIQAGSTRRAIAIAAQAPASEPRNQADTTAIFAARGIAAMILP